MATQKRGRLTLECEVCGEDVVLSPERFVKLVKAKELPRCRRNGCERLCGRKNAATARMPELLDTIEVPPRRVHWPRQKKGNPNGALAKLRVTVDQDWRYGDSPSNT